ncbi:MAG: hypothetical protein GDA51_05805 [Ekhidna sp.]|nr:hypothetical protein [Ekhidna sp.]
MLRNLGGFFCGAVVSLVKPPRCWETLDFCGAIVSLVKPSRCWETLKVFLWCCRLVG